MKHEAKSEALKKHLGNNIGYCTKCEKKHEKGKHEEKEHTHKSHHKDGSDMEHSHESHHSRDEEINGDEE